MRPVLRVRRIVGAVPFYEIRITRLRARPRPLFLQTEFRIAAVWYTATDFRYWLIVCLDLLLPLLRCICSASLLFKRS